MSLARAGSDCKGLLDLAHEQSERGVDTQRLCDVPLQHLHMVQSLQA